MKSIIALGELEETRELPLALVFIYVDWAIQARQSQAALGQFVEAWHATRPQCDLPVCRMDLSDQEGELWIEMRRLLSDENQPVDLWTYGGNGALLWLRFGCVAASVPNAAIVELSKLMAITDQVYV